MKRTVHTIVKITSVLILLLLLTGCNDITAEAKDPLSEEEVIHYVCDKIREECGDEVTATIVSKEVLRIPTAWFDGPIAYTKVEGGHSYVLEVRSKANSEIVSNAYYDDGYIEYSSKRTNDPSEHEPTMYHNYVKDNALYLVRREFEEVLKARFRDYAIYPDVSAPQGIDVFLLSSDYDAVSSALGEFNRIAKEWREQVYVTFSVYIYKDETVFRAGDHTRYPRCTEDFGGQSNGLDILRQLTNARIFSIYYGQNFYRDIFDNDGRLSDISGGSGALVPIDGSDSPSVTPADKIDTSNPDYVVFWYHSEPNAASHNGLTQVFGVKK